MFFAFFLFSLTLVFCRLFLCLQVFLDTMGMTHAFVATDDKAERTVEFLFILVIYLFLLGKGDKTLLKKLLLVCYF